MTSSKTRPRPVAADWAWQLSGACRGAEDAVFFHPDLERGSARRVRDEQAKAVCARCPVIVQCRRHAIAAEEPYGVWGGQDETERRAAIAHRRREARRLGRRPARSRRVDELSSLRPGV
jgi:WhiB family redox-sensing transcriptional regulator